MLSWGLQACLVILVCHSATSWSRSVLHTIYERGHTELSYVVLRLLSSKTLQRYDFWNSLNWSRLVQWNILDFIQQSFFSGGNSASARSTTSSAAFPSPSSPRPSIPSISDALAGKFNALVTIDPNWQSTKKSVRERNAVMCNNALMADVYFNVGADIGEDVTQIPAHKYVLSTSSTVFYAMFFGGLAEPRDVIDVPDVEPEAFLAMLRYMGWDYGIFKWNYSWFIILFNFFPS